MNTDAFEKALETISAPADTNRAFANVRDRFGELVAARAKERAAIEYLKNATSLRKRAELAFASAFVREVGAGIESEALEVLRGVAQGDVEFGGN